MPLTTGLISLIASCIVAIIVAHVFPEHDRGRIATGLRDLLTTPGIAVEGADDVFDALTLMADHGVDFPDAYLAAAANRRGDSVATFDADFRKLGARVVVL